MNDAVMEMDDEPILRQRLPLTEVFAEVWRKSILHHVQILCQLYRIAGRIRGRRVISTEQDMHGSTVKGVFMVSEPCDLLRHRRSFPPNRADTEGGASV